MYEYSQLKFCPKCKGELVEKVDMENVKRKICKECGYIMYRNPIPVGNAIVLKDGKILLVKRNVEPGKGEWALPGGFIEYDESPQDAAVRETFEETGMKTRIKNLIDVYCKDSINEQRVIPIVYSATIEGGTIKAGDDVSEVKFFSLDKMPKLAFKHNQKAIETWRKKYGR